jgi:hypothetical protein
MKIAITCDQVVERDLVTDLIEVLLTIFKGAEIYTLAHKEKAILGRIEERRIHSSFLSHKVKSKKELKNYAFLIPTAAKNLTIPCSIDLIINISTGFSQGFRKCKNTKLFTYLYDSEKSKGLFSRYLNQWKQKSLKSSNEVWVSSPLVLNNLSEIGMKFKIRPPCFKIEDYPLIRSSSFKHDYFLISTENISLNSAEKIFEYFRSSGKKAYFIGEDLHLTELKKNLNSSENSSIFIGDRCAGELAPILAASAGLIEAGKPVFPLLSLKALATGRPILIRNTENNRYFFKGPGVLFYDEEDEIPEILTNWKELSFVNDPKLIRRDVLKFDEQKFKLDLSKIIEGLMEVQ